MLGPGEVKASISARTFSDVLTFLGVSLMSFLIISLKRWNNFSQRILFFLTISCLIGSVNDVIGALIGETRLICQLQATAISFSNWGSSLWTCIFIWVLFLVVVWDVRTPEKYEKHYHGFVWPVAGVMALAPHFNSDPVYGQTGPWCWILEERVEWRLFSWYVPMYLMFTFCCVLCAWSWYTLSKQKSNSLASSSMVALNRRLVFYPLIFIFTWTFSSLNHLQNYINPHAPSFFLVFMSSLLEPLQGFLNCVLYCSDEATHQYLRPARLWSLFHGQVRPSTKPTSFQEFHNPHAVSDFDNEEYNDHAMVGSESLLGGSAAPAQLNTPSGTSGGNTDVSGAAERESTSGGGGGGGGGGSAGGGGGGGGGGNN